MSKLPAPFIALTDKAWFDFLSNRATNGCVDEVNFWSPTATKPIKQMDPGEPVFFRLKEPFNAIAGYGFFAHFALLDLKAAWDCFTWKNGDPDELRFLERIGEYRDVDLLDPRSPRQKLGCNILRQASLSTQARWIPWGEAMGWHSNIVRGKNADRFRARDPENSHWSVRRRRGTFHRGHVRRGGRSKGGTHSAQRKKRRGSFPCMPKNP